MLILPSQDVTRVRKPNKSVQYMLLLLTITIHAYCAATTTATTHSSTKTGCHPESCVPTVTVTEHLKSKDACKVQCSTGCISDGERRRQAPLATAVDLTSHRVRHIAVWMHEGRPGRDHHQDDLPDDAVLVVQRRLPVDDYCRVSEDDIQLQVSENAKFRELMPVRIGAEHCCVVLKSIVP